jgi:hypothetical protein
VRFIPFTEFVLPDGRQEGGGFNRPDNVADKADAIREAGYRFEIERLRTGHISMTIAGYCPQAEEETDVAQRVVPNGPEVLEAVDSMILEFEIP